MWIGIAYINHELLRENRQNTTIGVRLQELHLQTGAISIIDSWY